MFELDESLTHIEATPERVVAIIGSLNTPDVMTTLPKPEPTQAYVCTIQTGAKLDMFIYLYHQHSHVGRVYAWRGDPIDRNTFPGTESAALEFTESMGFLMDNAHYRKKPPEEQNAYFESLPCFHKDLKNYAKAQDAKDDPTLLDITEDLKEVDIPDEAGPSASAEPDAAEEVQIELIDADEDAESTVELETVEVEAGEDSAAAGDINMDDPFGELAEPPSAPAPAMDGEPAPTVEENPFAGSEDDLAKDLDATLDRLVPEEAAPASPAAAGQAAPPPSPPPSPPPAPAPVAPSLEEELLAEPPEPPAAAGGSALDAEALRGRLRSVGRFYGSW